MRQRNDTGSAWTFMGDPPVQVLPGEEHDHDVLLDGWTAVDEPETQADEAPSKTPSRKRAAAADTDKDGGEPR
ncbi:hypothetical protein [Streptomyces mirabilis]|uniref:hypothetical protein n=1 Tax=Streptomyces mirabilis TaxID=68239 RepID=UPI0033F6F809